MRWLVCLVAIAGLAVQQMKCCCRPGECVRSEQTTDVATACCGHHHAHHDGDEHESGDADDSACRDQIASEDADTGHQHDHHFCVGTHIFYQRALLCELPELTNTAVDSSILESVLLALKNPSDCERWQRQRSPRIPDRSLLCVYLV